MKDLLAILDFMSPDPIWDLLADSHNYMGWVAPIMLVLCLLVRTGEALPELMKGNMSFTKVLVDTFWATVGVFFYGLLIYFIVSIIIYLGSAFYNHGSFSMVSAEYLRILNEIESSYQDPSFLDQAINILNFNTKAIAWGLFFLSFGLVVLLNIVIRLGYAMVFVLNAYWGYIAIPTIGSKIMGMEKGWIKTWIGLGILPIIESILYLFLLVFLKHFADDVSLNHGAHKNITQAGYYMLFFVLNFAIVAIMIASLWAAYMLSNNQSILMSGMAPFLAAGGAAWSMLKERTSAMSKPIASPFQERAENISGSMSRVNENALGGMANIAKTAAGKIYSSITGNGESTNSNDSTSGTMDNSLGDALSSADRGATESTSNNSQPSASGNPMSDIYNNMANPDMADLQNSGLGEQFDQQDNGDNR